MRRLPQDATAYSLHPEPVTRIGLALPAWEAGALPLSYTDRWGGPVKQGGTIRASPYRGEGSETSTSREHQ